MHSGIKIKDLIVGNGKVADRTSIAVAHIRGNLRRGDEVCNTRKYGQPDNVDLARREHIAGLRKGIEGMRVGGKRELIISPHLAYGEKGIPGSIPPNAIIQFEVELLDVREPGNASVLTGPTGKYLSVFRPGEAARNLARWQFNLSEKESVSSALITHPLQGIAWRHCRPVHIKTELDSTEMAMILETSQSTLAEHPGECLKNEQMWADSSEKANSITREQGTDLLCVTISIWERNILVMNYGLTETSPLLLNSKFYQIISKALVPHLVK